jgi:bifunctional UDP-N-acetylglucosamine pyrophosphorylase / glucosamine-1-phosphate N-acetyltransferase
MEAIILAAGKGSRMGSELPKPLLPVAGKPMIEHVLDTLQEMKSVSQAPCVVYGYGAKAMQEQLGYRQLRWAQQETQLGTGHAVKCGIEAMQDVTDETDVMILYGDVPLITSETLLALQDVHQSMRADLTLLTVRMQDPTGYGRIVRDSEGHVRAIVEQKDATPSQLEIDEVNTGIMIVDMGMLRRCLQVLKNDNAQQEYYLTDIVEMAVADGNVVDTHCSDDPVEVSGANTPEQLRDLEMDYFLRTPE